MVPEIKEAWVSLCIQELRELKEAVIGCGGWGCKYLVSGSEITLLHRNYDPHWMDLWSPPNATEYS